MIAPKPGTPEYIAHCINAHVPLVDALNDLLLYIGPASYMAQMARARELLESFGELRDVGAERGRRNQREGVVTELGKDVKS